MRTEGKSSLCRRVKREDSLRVCQGGREYGEYGTEASTKEGTFASGNGIMRRCFALEVADLQHEWHIQGRDGRRGWIRLAKDR